MFNLFKKTPSTTNALAGFKASADELRQVAEAAAARSNEAHDAMMAARREVDQAEVEATEAGALASKIESLISTGDE